MDLYSLLDLVVKALIIAGFAFTALYVVKGIIYSVTKEVKWFIYCRKENARIKAIKANK
jgi:hypothetical protein